MYSFDFFFWPTALVSAMPTKLKLFFLPPFLTISGLELATIPIGLSGHNNAEHVVKTLASACSILPRY